MSGYFHRSVCSGQVGAGEYKAMICKWVGTKEAVVGKHLSVSLAGSKKVTRQREKKHEEDTFRTGISINFYGGFCDGLRVAYT